MRTFLSAEWNDLINITYAVEPEQLRSLLPAGLELDTIGGKAFLSLVAFRFDKVKVRGIRIPFHDTFPEINLRFYVKHNGRRGVVFIKEFVPKFLVASVARNFYNEPYSTIRMKEKRHALENGFRTEHQFRVGGESFSISLSSSGKLSLPASDSPEHFFKEHDIGYGRDRKGNTLAYEVQHPVWEIYDVREHSLKIDFEKIYGKEWAFLNKADPYHVLFAKGSGIKIFGKKKI